MLLSLPVLSQRLIFGPIMIAALVGLMWLDEVAGRVLVKVDGLVALPKGGVLLLAALAVALLVARELAYIFQAAGVRASARSMWAAGALGLIGSWIAPALNGHGAAAMNTAIALALVGGAIWHIRHKQLEGAAGAIASTLFGFVYLGVLFGFLLALRQHQPAWVILGILVVTKSSDIGAYFTGRAIGRHHLIPWLSPKKTWEGLAGGMALAAILGAVATVLGRATLPEETFRLTPLVGFLAGGVAGILGQAGDLLASTLKRDAHQKDSGSTIPGFGGVLDVVDSLLLVAPGAYWLLRL